MTGSPDMVWGYGPRGSFKPGGGKSASQWFAFIAGVSYVGIGLIGFFITGFDSFTEVSGEKALGIFSINPFHNIVHIGVGALWLTAALLLTRPAAEGANFAIGGFYVLAAVLGYLGYLNLVGIDAALDPVNFFHLISGVLSVLFSGLIGAGSGSGSGSRQPAGAR